MSRRLQILRRATEIFERQGVAHTSMEEIAKAVGLKREALYYYFKSREDILLEIILPQSNSLNLNLRGVLNSNLGSMEKLHGAIQVHLNSYNPGYLEMSVMLRETHFFKDTRKLKELRRTWHEYTDMWVGLVEEGQSNGTFNATLDAKMVSFAMLGMCNWVSRWYDPARNVSIPELIETFFTLCSSGVAPPVGAVQDEVATVPA